MQRGQKGAFCCVLDDLYKLHEAAKVQIIQGTFTLYKSSDDFVTFLRCNPEMYLELLERVGPRVHNGTHQPGTEDNKFIYLLHFGCILGA